MSVKQVPKSEKSTTKKPKKKFVGLAAKAKRRKQVSESRLAQRTGVSEKDRKRLKQLREFFKSMKGFTGGKTLSPTDMEWMMKGLRREKRQKHGGKVK